MSIQLRFTADTMDSNVVRAVIRVSNIHQQEIGRVYLLNNGRHYVLNNFTGLTDAKLAQQATLILQAE